MRIAWIFAHQILNKNLQTYSEVPFNFSYLIIKIIQKIMTALFDKSRNITQTALNMLKLLFSTFQNEIFKINCKRFKIQWEKSWNLLFKNPLSIHLQLFKKESETSHNYFQPLAS